MAWYWPFGKPSGGKSSTAKTNNQAEASAVEPDTKNARNSVASTINRGSLSAKDDTAAINQLSESMITETSNPIEQQTANVKEYLVAPTDTKVEKLKHNKRPGMSSHDSVSDKFKHAFKLDHKQHHPQKDASSHAAET